MNTRQAAISLRKKLNAVDWKLLVFLVLVMDVKLLVKLIAIAAIFIMQPKPRISFNFKNARLPLFYAIMILIVITDGILYQTGSSRYPVIAFTAIAYWTASIAAVHYVKQFVENNSVQTLHNTLQLFFMLNIVSSLINVLLITSEIGWKNPFLYQGQYQKYFINTGDYIKGMSFDTSTTNAIINCFGVVYFLFRKKYRQVLACMAVLLLTASNLSNLILLLVFAALFAFNSTREQKSTIVICTAMLVLFFIKCSPQNEKYVSDTVAKFFLKTKTTIAASKEIPIRERPDSLLTTETRKEKIATLYLDSLEQLHNKQAAIAGSRHIPAHFEKPAVPTDSIHTASFQWKRDTTVFQRQLIAYEANNAVNTFSGYPKNIPGKLLSLQQSIHFLQQQPAKLITGDGAGNFSSKLAFRVTGLKIAGAFPASFTWCNPDFFSNHLGLYIYYFTRHADAHSVIHSPASVYDQLLTEYGLVGLIAFIIFYPWFFYSRIDKKSYALPLLALMLAFFSMDYWFEQLSVVILFECMMFLSIKESDANFA